MLYQTKDLSTVQLFQESIRYNISPSSCISSCKDEFILYVCLRTVVRREPGGVFQVYLSIPYFIALTNYVDYLEFNNHTF